MRMNLGDTRLVNKTARFNWHKMCRAVAEQFWLATGTHLGHIRMEEAELLADNSLKVSANLPLGFGRVCMTIPKKDWRWAPELAN